MRSLRAFLLRLAGSFAGTRRDRDIEAELASHLQLHIDDNIRGGMTPVEARRVALIRLGGAAQAVERYRDRRGLPFVDTLRQDLVYGLRTLRKHRGFTATAVLTLALGVGANTAIFSVVNAALLRPLPFQNPSALVMVFATDTRRGNFYDETSYPALLDWREQNRSFESIGAFANRMLPVAVGDEVALARGKVVTSDFFEVLGVQPARGRSLRNWRPGDPDAVLLSDAFAARYFGGSDAAVGQSLRIDNRPHAIVGVLPAGFRLDGDSEEFYQPLGIDQNRGHGFLHAVARLRPGVSLQQARDDMTAIAARLERLYPGPHANVGAHVVPLSDALARNIRPGLLIMLGVVAFVLLIACANVAGLLLARGVARQQELAIRVALGAGRLRIARQLMTESVLIGIAGGAIGLALAAATTQGLAAIVAEQFRAPGVRDVPIDLTVLAFTLGVSIIAGLVFGAIPAFAVPWTDANNGLRDVGRAYTSGRTPRIGRGLVVVETALALVLLAGAGTLLKTFLSLRATAPGFDAAHVVKADLLLPMPAFSPRETRAAYFADMLERVRALPGVRSAALVSNLPLNGFDTESFHIVGKPDPRRGGFNATFNTASAGYFRMMAIPVRAGREFVESDGPAAPGVIVINETAARTFWPGESAIGRQIELPLDHNIIAKRGPASVTLTVVGIVGDVRQAGLAVPPRPEIVLNAMQSLMPWAWITVAARAEGEPALMGESLRLAIRSANSQVPIWRVTTLADVVSHSIDEPRLYAFLVGSFAMLALVLASVGLSGLLAYNVSRRRREIGVRMALGAARLEIVRLVVAEGLGLVGVGAAIGLAGALLATRFLAGVVTGVRPSDPATFAAVMLALLGAAIVAAGIPARRAARVDPLVALRDD